jgi:hypothetical protein
MKKYFALLITILYFLIASAQTDTVTKGGSATAANKIYFMADSNKLVAVAEESAAMATKMKLGGFAGSSTAYIIEGPSSSLHINNQSPSFTIKLLNMGSMAMQMDPSNMMRLYKFESKGKNRESAINKSGVMGVGATSNMDGIKFTVKQGENSICILTPAEPLGPGEYSFVNLTAPKDVSNRRKITYAAFSFSIGK